ncbi:hypothetical protein GCM10011387_20240 [Pedobacter quisquiliarum]|uniref:Uncharacterized protein n=1 Tax=Pedobacter quisquiliarum TaxID=1834438 RepID=A0A916UAX0_9SPHI|nr:hypothetical protein [Pedobacter quisquiliarum]GGC66762.1 hypothetical protein GCM10011387_20240 [Pedobacter quisquiliarum]
MRKNVLFLLAEEIHGLFLDLQILLRYVFVTAFYREIEIASTSDYNKIQAKRTTGDSANYI